MKRTTGGIFLLLLTALALIFALSGCTEKKAREVGAADEATVMRFCDEIFASTYRIRVTDAPADGRVDEYDCAGKPASALNGSVAQSLAQRCESSDWTAATVQDWEKIQGGLTVEFTNGAYMLRIVPGERVLCLEDEETIYYIEDDSARASSFLFTLAQGAESERIYALCVDGAETDYQAIANELSRQFAKNLNAAPRWFENKPQAAAAVGDRTVFDAYYGEDYPNFCCSFGVMLRFEEDESAQRYNWEAGSGMIEPTGEGEYGDYFSWGLAADVCKNEEGVWYLEGTWTGGGCVWLPGIGRSIDSEQQLATAEELFASWFLTKGESREWRLPNMIYARPAEEFRAAFAALDEKRQEELETGLRAVWDAPLYEDYFPGGFDARLGRSAE